MGFFSTIRSRFSRKKTTTIKSIPQSSPSSSTTSTNQSTPAPNFQPAPTGNFTPAPTFVSGGGGGGSSGGGSSGGSSGGFTPAPTQTIAPTQSIPSETIQGRAIQSGVSFEVQVARENAIQRRNYKRAIEEFKVNQARFKDLEKRSIGGQTLRDGTSQFFLPPNQSFPDQFSTRVSPEIKQVQEVEKQTGAMSQRGLDRLVDFEITEPSFQKVIDAERLEMKALESGKFVLVKPFQVLSTAFKESGAELKQSKSKTLNVAGVGVGAVGELIPRTPLGLGIVAGGVKGIPLLAKPLRIGVLGGFAFEGGRGALNTDLTAEQRVASGIIGFGGLAGAVAETPFVANRRFLRLQNKKITETVKALERSGKFTPKEIKTIDVGLRAGVKLELPLRSVPDVPITKKANTMIPEDLTIPQKEVFAGVVFDKNTQFYGGQSLIARGVKKAGGDLDLATIKNLEKVAEVEGLLNIRSPRGTNVVKGGKEAIGLEGDKAFDIKSFERLKEFQLRQKPIKSPEGIKFTRTTEEFARNLSGTIQLRKGGKDIVPAINSARALIKQGIKQARVSIPVIKQFRTFKVRSQELKLIKLEKASKPLSRIFEVEINLPDIRTGLQTDTPPVLLPVPKSKKAQMPLTPLKLNNKPLRSVKNVFKIGQAEKGLGNLKKVNIKKLNLKPSSLTTSKIKPLKIPTSKIPVSTIKPSKLTPSKLTPSKLTPSRLSPSGLKPSKFTPSGLTPSKLTPSRLPPSIFRSSGFKPSKIPTSKLPPIRIPRTPEEIIPPRLNLKGARSIKKKKKRFKDDMGLSESFSQRQLLLKLPKNLLKADLKQRGGKRVRIK